MVLHSTGKVLEQQFGSFIFLCITILFLLIIGPLQIPLAIMFETITMNKIGLLSTNQCGVGYSGVLFAYFMIYLSLIPNQRINFCGYQVKKWVVPFIELIMLSVMLQASFIGHLSGIIVGLLYITGLPGCFQLRQTCMRNIEYIFCIIQCIINRQDYVKMPQHPKIDKFFCRSKYSQRNNGISQRIPDDVSDTSDETGMDNDETDVLMI